MKLIAKKWLFLLLQGDGSDTHAGMAMAPLVTEGAHPYVHYDTGGLRLLLSDAIYPGSDNFAPRVVPALNRVMRPNRPRKIECQGAPSHRGHFLVENCAPTKRPAAEGYATWELH